MSRIIVSTQQRQQLLELNGFSNLKYRNVLNGTGYAQFDLALSDLYADPNLIHAGSYVHIYSDTADTSSYANAEWGGVLTNDYEIKPKDGAVTFSAAGMAYLLAVSIVQTTQTYTNMDLGSIVQNLIATRDNQVVTLTPYTVSAFGPVINQFIAGWGDVTYDDITKLMSQYGSDFEVRPDFTYGYYVRQGVDRPDLAMLYGDQGNIYVDSTMHLVNSEMYNQVYLINGSMVVYAQDTVAAQFYGKRTLVLDQGTLQQPTTYDIVDMSTQAALEVAKRAYPLTVLDNIMLVDSPLCPLGAVNLGDRIVFQAPGLPFLSNFDGLQRILAMEWDDEKRVMNLTLGNAVYKVMRGKLHEVRLY